MKRLLSVCLSLCIMVSVFVSFDITASAKTNLKKTTVSASNISNGINVSWKRFPVQKAINYIEKHPVQRSIQLLKRLTAKL